MKKNTALLDNVALSDAFKQLKSQKISLPVDLKPTIFSPTGFDYFDNHILGTGGLPRGCIIHTFGAEQGGKTLFNLRQIAMEQERYPNKLQCIFDTEFRFNKEWAVRQGVDLQKVLVYQGNFAEEVLLKVLQLVDSGVISAVFLDSLANLIPEKSANYDDFYKLKGDGSRVNPERVAATASLNTRFVQQLVSLADKHNVLMIITNQLRSKVGCVAPETMVEVILD